MLLEREVTYDKQLQRVNILEVSAPEQRLVITKIASVYQPFSATLYDTPIIMVTVHQQTTQILQQSCSIQHGLQHIT